MLLLLSVNSILAYKKGQSQISFSFINLSLTFIYIHTHTIHFSISFQVRQIIICWTQPKHIKGVYTDLYCIQHAFLIYLEDFIPQFLLYLYTDLLYRSNFIIKTIKSNSFEFVANKPLAIKTHRSTLIYSILCPER